MLPEMRIAYCEHNLRTYIQQKRCLEFTVATDETCVSLYRPALPNQEMASGRREFEYRGSGGRISSKGHARDGREHQKDLSL